MDADRTFTANDISTVRTMLAAAVSPTDCRSIGTPNSSLGNVRIGSGGTLTATSRLRAGSTHAAAAICGCIRCTLHAENVELLLSVGAMRNPGGAVAQDEPGSLSC